MSLKTKRLKPNSKNAKTNFFSAFEQLFMSHLKHFCVVIKKFFISFFSTEAEGQNASVDGQQRSDLMKRQISTTGAKPSTIAEEAVDQLQENEKLVAGRKK